MTAPLIIQQKRDSRIVRVAPLVEMRFLGGTRRVWAGNREISAGGHSWFGLNKLGAMIDISDVGDIEASEMRFTLSGIDTRFLELFTMAADEARAEYVGRPVRVYECYFDDDWQVIESPEAHACGIMDSIEFDAHPVEMDGNWYTQHVITLTAQNLFSGRSGTSASFYSNLDQQRRSPGDRGLEYKAQLVELNIEVPW